MPIRFNNAEATEVRQFGIPITDVFLPLSAGESITDKNALSGAGPTGTITTAFQNGNTEAVLTAVPDGTSTYSYMWNNANDRSMVISTSQSLTVSADGTYEVVILDMNTGLTSDYICAVVDLNAGPSTVLVVNDASVFTTGSLSGNITVSDPDHSTTVSWNLTYNGSTIVSGTGNRTNQAFSGVSPGAAGTRNMVLTATDSDGATSTDTISISVTVESSVFTFTYGAVAGLTTTANSAQFAYYSGGNWQVGWHSLGYVSGPNTTLPSMTFHSNISSLMAFVGCCMIETEPSITVNNPGGSGSVSGAIEWTQQPGTTGTIGNGPVGTVKPSVGAPAGYSVVPTNTPSGNTGELS